MVLYKALFREPLQAKEVYEPTTVQEAYMAVFYSIVFADDERTEEELAALKQVILSLRAFEGEDDVYYLKKIRELAQIYPLKSLLTGGLKFIDPSQRAQLFCFCTELVVADDKITEEEKQILNYIADHSDLSPSLANNIIEVMLIRMGK